MAQTDAQLVFAYRTGVESSLYPIVEAEVCFVIEPPLETDDRRPVKTPRSLERNNPRRSRTRWIHYYPDPSHHVDPNHANRDW